MMGRESRLVGVRGLAGGLEELPSCNVRQITSFLWALELWTQVSLRSSKSFGNDCPQADRCLGVTLPKGKRLFPLYSQKVEGRAKGGLGAPKESGSPEARLGPFYQGCKSLGLL